MSTEGVGRDDIRLELARDASAVGDLSPHELEELARLAADIASLPRELPNEEEMESGRARLMESLKSGAGLGWAAGLPIVRMAAVLVMAVVLGLLALGGAFAAGARLPQPVAVGPLGPLGNDRAEVARDNHGQEVAEVARSGGGPGHGQEVRDAALDNRGRGGSDSGPGRSDDTVEERTSDNGGPGSISAADNIELVGTVQQVGDGRVVVNGIVVLVTTATEVEGSLSAGVAVKVEGTLQSDGTVVAREIEVQVEPGAAAPGPAPSPAATPQVRIELRGRVQSVTEASFVVAGRTVHITGSTEVDGRIREGVVVKVEGVLQSDNSVLAREVKVEGAGGSGPGPSFQSERPTDDRGGQRGRGGGGD